MTRDICEMVKVWWPVFKLMKWVAESVQNICGRHCCHHHHCRLIRGSKYFTFNIWTRVFYLCRWWEMLSTQGGITVTLITYTEDGRPFFARKIAVLEYCENLQSFVDTSICVPVFPTADSRRVSQQNMTPMWRRDKSVWVCQKWENIQKMNLMNCHSSCGWSGASL